MIDTIILLIPPQHFKILTPQNFNPIADLVYQGITNKAYDLFIGSEVDEKRQLIKFLLQNIRFDGQNVLYDAQKPLAVAIRSYHAMGT